ncbi:MAG: M1 family metallopeptidase [Bacteroidia bacterium]|nr:M1 family metallopeptidase [Bacteroidia bacterium]
MFTKNISIFSIVLLLTTSVQANPNDFELDVISYHLTIEPDIEKKYISGTVVIKFQIENDANSVAFKSGNLRIDKVTGDNVVGFENRDGSLIIKLSEREEKENELTIDYHGNPTNGLLFDTDRGQTFTVYSTSQWMICNDSPGDKALFYLDISVPADKDCIASGELVSQVRKNGKIQYSYQQNYESPTYTYGFAIGNFNQTEEKSGEVLLRYYSRDYTSGQLMTIFKETPTMISFFEEKSGVKYDQSRYSQILIGNHYQEMSGYSTLKETYGELVLKDSTETNLISHELAHQWWGNRVTCKSWNHFWLNEAMATYLSAAYNEYRFGRDKYQSDIDSYYEVYKAVKNRGNDKPLVFANWSNPSSDDRNLVYFKGAYVLHLLREKIGDEIFWDAIKFYTSKYFGESVETTDFQKALEESSGVQLDDFFNEWIYRKER